MVFADLDTAAEPRRWRWPRLPRLSPLRSAQPTVERSFIATVSDGETVRFAPPPAWAAAHGGIGPRGRRQAWVDILLLRPFGAEVGALMAEVRPTGEVFLIGDGVTKTFRQGGDVYALVNPSPLALMRARGASDGPSGGFGATATPGGAPGGPPPPTRTLWERALLVWDNTHGFPFIAGLLGLACLALTVLPQGQDLVTAIIDGDPDHPSPALADVAVLTGAVLFATLQAWFWARRIVVSNFGVDRSAWETGVLGWYLRAGPRVLAFTPFVAIVLILLFGDRAYWWSAALVAVVGAAALAWLIARHDLALGRPGGGAVRRAVSRRLRARPWRQERLSYFVIFSGPLLAPSSLICICANPAQGLATMNPPALVFVGLGLMVQPMIVAIQAGHYIRFPTIPALLICAVLFSLWNDNHQVRTLPGAGMPVRGRETLRNAFDRWKRQAAPGADGRIPMVLVATEGGASRAGLWTAEVLGRLEEESGGAFSRHVFTVSSVSGGSVGAVGFAAEVGRPDSSGTRGLRERLLAFAGQNFLSPALGGLLWPDAFARLWPFPPGVLPSWPDRATALERGFEVGWDSHCPPQGQGCRGRLAGSFLNLFPSGPGARWVPLVIVNGSHQENGSPVLTSPVLLPDSGPAEKDASAVRQASCLPTAQTSCAIDAADFFSLDPHDVRGSTAIHNGARFPVISPSGGLDSNGHVIDGGYFDNSGTDTVRQLARLLSAKDLKDVRPVLITIGYEETRAIPGATPSQANATAARPRARNPLRGLVAPWVAALFPRSEKVGFQRSSVIANDALGPLKGLAAIKGAHERQLRDVLSQELTPSDLVAKPTAEGWSQTRFILCPDRQNTGVSMNWFVSQRGQDVVKHGFDASRSPCGSENTKALVAIKSLFARGSKLP